MTRNSTALNPAQQQALEYLDGPLLVLAGAGTGKTRVITERMVEIIRRGTPPERILSVTFTNKAAREMLGRTAALLGRRPKRRPWISTFHALCVSILRREAEQVGYPPSFVIFDSADQEAAARAALRQVRLDNAAVRPRDLLSQISRWKMRGFSPAEARQVAEDDRDLLIALAYRRYQDALTAALAFDFDDLLLRTHKLFAERPDVLARHQGRFDHVQIDEYQDTNALQFQIVAVLVAGHRRICVVGDDDQSIYGWRGAEVAHILNFESHFPGAKVVRLEENYRCTEPILTTANNLVQYNRGRHPKVLRGHKPSREAVRFLTYQDDVTEAEQLVLEVDYLVKQELARPDEIAILYRTNDQPRLFETELRRRKLPYVLLGGRSFFDFKEVRDLLAYLRAITNPRDDHALLRIANVPARGVGNTTLKAIVEQNAKCKRRFWQAHRHLEEAGRLSRPARSGLAALERLLEDYRRRYRQKPRHLAETTSRLIEEIRYRDEIEKNYNTSGQRMTRAAMLTELIESQREYASRQEKPSLAGFLQETTLGGRDEGFSSEKDRGRSGIRLLTLHSAKGLEFPHVYLVGLEEGLLPHRRSMEGTLAMIEEERRLAYVGITRAMDRLTITRARHRKKWGKPRRSIPSRFLREMRNADVETVQEATA